MRQGTIRLFGALTVVSAAVAWHAQGFGGGFGYNCIDVNNMTPFSNPYIFYDWGNNVMMASLGVVGTVTFGGTVSMTDPDPPCFIPAVTASMTGRFGFGAGTDGSVQSGFDDAMAYSFGYSIPGADWGYAMLTTDSKTMNGQPASTRSVFGANTLITAFIGASDRYMFEETVNGTTDIQLRMDEIGDAARIQWILTNTDTANSHTLGLWVGMMMAMFSPSTGDLSGFEFSANMWQDYPYGASGNSKLG